MTGTASSVQVKGSPDLVAPPASVLHVCTSCERVAAHRVSHARASRLQTLSKLRATFHESPLGHHVRSGLPSASVVPAPVRIALSSPGAIPDQHPGEYV